MAGFTSFSRAAVCVICGAAFVATHPRSKNCSPACSQESNKRAAALLAVKRHAQIRKSAKESYERNREQVIAASRAYARSDRGKEVQRKRSAVRRVAEKAKVDARTKLNNALRYGRIVRGACRDCGSPDTHGHHPDYSRPLDVIWLCQEHHIAEHRRIDSGSESI